MEKKHTNLADFDKEEKPALTILGILKESFKTTLKNGKIILSIAFFMFIYYCFLSFSNHLMLEPFYSNLVLTCKDKCKRFNFHEIDPETRKSIIKIVRFIIIYELIIWAFSYLIQMIALSFVVLSTQEAYTSKLLSFKKIFLSIRTSWKRPLITSFWMFIISLVSIIFFLIVFGFIAVFTEGTLSVYLVIGLVIFGVCFYIFLSVIWILSLVVSILEENNSSGIKAIERAREIMKGKKLQGCVLMLILILVGVVIFYGTFPLLAMMTTHKSRLIKGAIGVSEVWLFCLEKLFVFVVFTLFYNECKRSHHHHHPVEEEKTSVYVPISNVEV